MSTPAPVGVDLQLVLDPSLRERLEKLAAAIGRDASELAGAVLRAGCSWTERPRSGADARAALAA